MEDSYLTKTPQFIKATSVNNILSESNKSIKRTKTICTIGPKTGTPSNAALLIDQGMNVARLNFSHGDHQIHKNFMDSVIQAQNISNNSCVGILLDTKGPQIRTGFNQNQQMIQLKKGQTLEITTDYSQKGTSKRIACSYQQLPKSTSLGSSILIADGGISTKVIKIQESLVTVEVLNDGKIGSKKNMCLPGCIINLPTITKKDQIDIIDFGLKHKVNYIAVSFTRYKKDLDELRKLIMQKDPLHGPYIRIISKIQNHEGIQNLDQIIEGSDGIMVARGDLGMEVPIQKVVILQKYIIDRTINAGKIVITATQMLESMQQKPRPTRAQVADVTNSICDLADANMTSGQTANGLFPKQSAMMLKNIAEQVENYCDYYKSFLYRKEYFKNQKLVDIVDRVFSEKCDLILVKTNNIRFVTQISSLRPYAYIIVITDVSQVHKALALNFGVYTFNQKQYGSNLQFVNKFRSKFGFSEKVKIMLLQTIQNELKGTICQI